MRAVCLLASAGAALIAVPAAAAPARHAPARYAPAQHAPAQNATGARDWSRTVVATPEGGFRMGNPGAKVKLVEYGSLTCSHCARFAHEGVAGLVRDHVRTGRTSYEYRNFVLNGIDVAASILARCAGAPGFFRVVGAVYAGQESWLRKTGAVSPAVQAQLEAMPTQQRLARIAQIAGLGQYAALGGVTPARANACLADKSGLDRLTHMYEAGASQYAIEGTPTFLINGAKADANTWAGLEPLIVQAGG